MQSPSPLDLLRRSLRAALLSTGPAAFAFAVSATAPANGQVSAQNPGSLLIFPEYDNRVGQQYLITVTNTNADLAGGSIHVEFVYVNSTNCQEFNRTEPLTPRDTLTLLTSYHNFDDSRGFLYVFVKNPLSGAAISHDFLIGHSLAINGIDTFEYSLNPVALMAGPLAQGVNTDLDNDGRRDLNDLEYQSVADRIHIPRFFGQLGTSGGPLVQSDLILLSLAGGSAFTTTVYFQAFNDNEETFSTTRSFFCWTRIPLSSISPIFRDDFLTSTNHNPAEPSGLAGPETGWFWMDGLTATSVSDTIQDPAFLGVLIEQSGSQSASDLPFGDGQQNGELLNNTPFSNL